MVSRRLTSSLLFMKRIPVVSRSKPLIYGVPQIFDLKNFPSGNFFVIPKTIKSSQNYFAIEVLPPDLINNSEVYVVAGDSPIIGAFLASSVFPIWLRGISGRKEGKFDFKKIYNSFPFPEFNKRQEENLIDRFSGVLKARGAVSGKLLSEIYTSGGLPDHLEMAHEDLDEVVLDIFGLPADATNDEILEKLFSEYMRLINN